MPFPANTTTTIIPTLRYRNAVAMIDWLCTAFGFTRHAVYAEDYGGRGYACRDPEGHTWWFGTYDPWKAA